MPETAHDRDLALDFTKGVLIILVIVGHLIQYILYRNEGFWDSASFKWIYMFHMPLFMAISGYLSCRALTGKPFTKAICDRAMQLLLPMLFWCSLLETLKLTVFPRPAGAADNVLQFLNDFAGTYWFVWAAFICFLLAKTISIFNHSSSWVFLVSVILVVLAPLTFSIFPLIKYTYPFFCLGLAFAQSERWTSIVRSQGPFLIMSASMVAMICFLIWRNDTYVYNNLALVQDLQSAKNVLLMFLGSAAASAVMNMEYWPLKSGGPLYRRETGTEHAGAVLDPGYGIPSNGFDTVWRIVEPHNEGGRGYISRGNDCCRRACGSLDRARHSLSVPAHARSATPLLRLSNQPCR
ncbi:fucose 4-O-acetylase-like acetyltransferase [Bradyrhizobium sp. CIR48]|nr:fucose 4-O-acetylase-like acetyltransferase [Bradyrhizobium sp. CIR48]